MGLEMGPRVLGNLKLGLGSAVFVGFGMWFWGLRGGLV